MKTHTTETKTTSHISLLTSDWRWRCVTLALGTWLFTLYPLARAVVPPPDGCYPGFTTAEGCNALQNLTSGAGNTGVGWRALFSDSTGSFNTAVGAGALVLNSADSNTAVGAASLLLNITGTNNTAHGASTLVHNDIGYNNTAVGYSALFSNTTGLNNTANGALALNSNTTGLQNTANGAQALESNTTGENNTAIGTSALSSNTTGVANTAVGALAGSSITGSGNVCIGSGLFGVAGESDTTRIRNIYSSVASVRAVYVNADDKLGTLSSSQRYKQQIQPMEQASETLFALQPVTFRYNEEVDASQALSFGLIAEQVAEVNPELITRDEEGRPQTVRYEAVNAMLLNEFLKEHKRVEELKSNAAKQEATISELKKGVAALTTQIEEQTARIDRITARNEMDHTVTRMVVNEGETASVGQR